MPALIDDGYTRAHVITATARRAAVRIYYRPLLAAERRRLNAQTVRLAAHGKPGRDAATQLVVAALAARLVDWDAADADGKPLDINNEVLAALEPDLFEEICAAVTAFNDETASAKN